MRPVYKSITGVSVSTPAVVDYLAKDFQLGVQVKVGAGDTCTVNYTLDDIFDPTVTPEWFPVTGLTAIVADTVAQVTTPCRALQLQMTAGTGTAIMTVVQSSPGP